MHNEAGKKLASVVFGSMVHQELKNLCSNHFDSILRENHQLQWSILVGIQFGWS